MGHRARDPCDCARRAQYGSFRIKELGLLIGTIAATCGLVSVGIGALTSCSARVSETGFTIGSWENRIRQFHFSAHCAVPQILELLNVEKKQRTSMMHSEAAAYQF
jgi:hypothetical protein